MGTVRNVVIVVVGSESPVGGIVVVSGAGEGANVVVEAITDDELDVVS